MRITNKIMQNNSLYNINSNKVSENDISTSIMTGKKVNRPSEDPVVAIRSLRLRANVTELNQYYERNAEDAESWLTVTEGALTSISGQDSILVDLQKLLVAGPDKYKTLSDWDAIVTQIEQLADEYYSVGNVDYAGRYAFTGYRTDTSLSFLEDTSKKYEDIQDEFNAGNIDTSDRVTSIGEFASGDETTNPRLESHVSEYTVGRLRLSYDNLDAEAADEGTTAANQTKLDAAKQALQAAQDALSQKETALKKANKDLEAARDELQKARQELTEAKQNANAAAQAVTHADSNLKSAQTTYDRAIDVYNAAVKNREDKEAELKAARDAADEAHKATDTAKKAYDDMIAADPDLKAQNDKVGQAQSAVETAQTLLDQKKAELEALSPYDPSYPLKRGEVTAAEKDLKTRQQELYDQTTELNRLIAKKPENAAIKAVYDQAVRNGQRADGNVQLATNALTKAQEAEDAALQRQKDAEKARDDATTALAAKEAEKQAADDEVNNKAAVIPGKEAALDAAELVAEQAKKDYLDATPAVQAAQKEVTELRAKADVFTLQYREGMVPAAISTVIPSGQLVPGDDSLHPAGDGVHTVNLSFTTSDRASHTVHLPTWNGMGGANGEPVEVNITNPDGTKETYTARVIMAPDPNDPSQNVVDHYEVEYIVDKAGNPDGKDYIGTIYVNAQGVIYDNSKENGKNTPIDFPAKQEDINNNNARPEYADIQAATTTVTKSQVTEVKLNTPGELVEVVRIPLSDETKQPYEMTVKSETGKEYTVTVNTDGTYQLVGTGCKNNDNQTGDNIRSVVQITSGGAIHSSYIETDIRPTQIIGPDTDAETIDKIYQELSETYDTNEKWPDGGTYVVNAATGEILFSKGLNDKLSSLNDIINANTLNAVYDKTNFVKGDTRPENLFACTNDGVKYNIGTAGHTMEYDVGYNQKIEVNTMANDVFTNDVKRDAQDLRRILDQMKDVNNKINILQAEYNNSTSETDKKEIQKEINAAKKAYDYLTDIMKDEFGAKITGVSKAIDMANNAVTVNGTRSKRLDLISARLMDQVATFQELQSENEDVDLAEAGTMLAMARLTYEASLQATGKIMTTSLMDYI